MSNEGMVFTISTAVVLLSIIISLSMYHIKDRELMYKNIETAIGKGIDPMAVRCSYAHERDFICVAYAASNGHQTPTPPTKK